MATEPGTPVHPVIGALLAEGHRYSFFQVVGLLERHLRARARVGHQGPAAAEAVRLRPWASLSFPSSDVVKVETARGDAGRPDRYRVTVSFLGLYGSASPLPPFYTEDLIDDEAQDGTVRAFLDIFHHRILSLFYRGWLKYRYHALFEPGGRDAFSGNLRSLIGLGTAGLADGLRLPVLRLLRYAGLFTQQVRSACGLEGLLEDYFGGPAVRVRPCAKRWMQLRDDDRNELGRRNVRLGRDLVVGARVPDRSGLYEISIGPVGLATYLDFLPEGQDFPVLLGVAAFYVRDPLVFQVELRLRADEVPRLRLSSAGEAQLGRTAWLKSRRGEDATIVLSRVECAGGPGSGSWTSTARTASISEA